MKRGRVIVAVAIIAGLALSGPAFAAGGGGQGKGRAIQKQAGSMNQDQKR